MKDMIDVAIAQTNQSFRDSGVGNVHVKLAHAYETDYVESGSHFEDVYRFRNKPDAILPPDARSTMEKRCWPLPTLSS